MRLPWISRKRHGEIVSYLRQRGDDMLAEHDRLRTSHQALGDELANVRLELIGFRNKCATLDGQLAAERHGKGLPASPPNDEAAP